MDRNEPCEDQRAEGGPVTEQRAGLEDHCPWGLAEGQQGCLPNAEGAAVGRENGLGAEI